jgi:hypothetical protein
MGLDEMVKRECARGALAFPMSASRTSLTVQQVGHDGKDHAHHEGPDALQQYRQSKGGGTAGHTAMPVHVDCALSVSTCVVAHASKRC